MSSNNVLIPSRADGDGLHKRTAIVRPARHAAVISVRITSINIFATNESHAANVRSFTVCAAQDDTLCKRALL